MKNHFIYVVFFKEKKSLYVVSLFGPAETDLEALMARRCPNPTANDKWEKMVLLCQHGFIFIITA